MPFEEGHKKVGGRTKGSGNKRTKLVKDFIAGVPNTPQLKRKYIKEMKELKGKQYIDAYHASLEFSIGKMNKIDPGQKKLPPINITLVAASPKETTEHIIDITPHEEINPDSQEESQTPRLREGSSPS